MIEIEFDPRTRKYIIVAGDHVSRGLSANHLKSVIDAPEETIEALMLAARRCAPRPVPQHGEQP
jgi:hypothetical protein